MNLLLNLSVEPFFIGFLQDDGKVVVSENLSNGKTTGKEIFVFLEKNLELCDELSWVGGVTGPGGFSTLRNASSVLNALSFRYKVPVKSLTAFEWIGDWMTSTDYDRFVLNSFSDKVFLYEKDDFALIPLSEVAQKENCWYGALPMKKQEKEKLKNQSRRPNVESLYKIIVQKKGLDQFEPEYFFDAVQG